MIRSQRTGLIAAVLGTAALSLAWAAQPGHEERQTEKGLSAMPEGCATMMKMRDEMASKQKESDGRLDRLLAAMDKASGAAKVDAMGSVVSELVKQRTGGREQMMHMQSAMMRHMMQHTTDAAPADMCEKMKKSVDACPTMHVSAGEGH